MNNQAAQTMPSNIVERLASAKDKLPAGSDERMAVWRAIEYFRAISQTAGVVEPNGKLVGWWNGIMPDVTERSPYGPSVRWGADAEDSAHDIPLYDGYNPIHFTKPILPSVEAFASAVWRDWMTNEQADKLGAELHAWLRAHIAAAPAASGGDGEMCPNCVTPWKCNGPHALPPSAPHPDALPDGTLSRSTAKRVEALAASGGEDRLTRAEAIAEFRSRTGASVSERARALMAKAYRDGGYPHAAGTLEAGVIDSVDACALSAIEQALTQQRGAVLDRPARVGGCLRHPYTGELRDYRDVESDPDGTLCVGPGPLAATTPQPSADAVREYVTELRAQADQKMGVAGACAHDGDRAHYKSAAQLLRRVADELESLLSAASGEGVGK